MCIFASSNNNNPGGRKPDKSKKGAKTMKTFNINIHHNLQNIEVTVKNGRKFNEDLIKGAYGWVEFTTNECDALKIKQFVVKHANDKSSNRGNWYAHCNGYAMCLCVTDKGKTFRINTYRAYGKSEPTK